MPAGSCLCGAVAFEIDGSLTPIQFCHAKRCQKSTGSAFAPEVAAREDQFRWVRGAEQLRSFEAPLLHEPPPFRRTFCSHCGSPMPVVREGTGWVVLLAGVLDDPSGTQPFRRIFVEHAPDWYSVESDDGLQHHLGRPPASERLPRRPPR